MDNTDRMLLMEIEGGIPLSDHPYREIGRRTGIPESEVIRRLQILRTQGVIRRFRARIDQRKAGITANALVAWDVHQADVSSLGARVAEFPGVTHCYRRRPVPGRWDYELYTVHHSRRREDLCNEVAEIAADTGIDTYLVLFSGAEYKRSPTGSLRNRKEQE
ncbi:DNA-binding Lrp family transcriptional regulator [Methanolinea mesophila]|uniref:siroheme decarboxylase subunit beta n=1 Tax=Methanolinea mesophila TaxID=547055 RepID=UPI001AE16D13|nr:siroheme decarboxylase subunit beta [Methanolinea mesophila]MBP1927917.1 DNA-binding Lrp family transcriptional regulator [Methanolinea mesophila]